MIPMYNRMHVTYCSCLENNGLGKRCNSLLCEKDVSCYPSEIKP